MVHDLSDHLPVQRGRPVNCPLEVGEPVARDDGRFYVPISRTVVPESDPRSRIVARVASDAFYTLDEARALADALTKAFNAALVEDEARA